MNEHRPSPPVTYDTIVELLETIAGHLTTEAERHTQAVATISAPANTENT